MAKRTSKKKWANNKTGKLGKEIEEKAIVMFQVSPREKRRLKRWARQDETSVSGYIRDALF
jgi:hypothetical protein